MLRDTLYLTVHAIDSLDLARAGFKGLDWRSDGKGAITVAAKVTAATATLGKSLYAAKGCIGCHSIDGTKAGKTGPTFKALYGSSVKLTNGKTLKADDVYLTRAILDPAKEIVQGFEPGMPTFRGVLSDAEVESLIKYIKTIR